MQRTCPMLAWFKRFVRRNIVDDDPSDADGMILHHRLDAMVRYRKHVGYRTWRAFVLGRLVWVVECKR